MKHVALIRTHKNDTLTQLAIQRVYNAFNQNAWIVCDERRGPVDFGNINKVSITHDSLKDMQLFTRPRHNILWQCGDYFYYAALNDERLKDAEYFWLIEPDVYLDFQYPAQFFNQFKDNDTDVLLTHYKKAFDGWAPGKSLEGTTGLDIQRCFFPISRLSRRAAEHFFRRRQFYSQIAEHANRATQYKWLHDEAFFANEWLEEGMTRRSFDDFVPGVFTEENFEYKPHKKKYLVNFMSRPATNKAYHPIHVSPQLVSEQDKHNNLHGFTEREERFMGSSSNKEKPDG